MNIFSMRLMAPTNSLEIPSSNNHIALGLFGENILVTDILSEVKDFGIKTIFIPNESKPVKSYMDSNYRNVLKSCGLNPIRGNFEDVSAIKNKSFIIDLTLFLGAMDTVLGSSNFKSKKLYTAINKVVSDLNNVTNCKRILLYVVDLDKPFTANINHRRFGAVMLSLLQSKDNINSIPFDQLICYSFSKSKNINNYVLLFDKESPSNPGKIKRYIQSLTYSQPKSKNKSKIDSDDGDLVKSREDIKNERYEKMKKHTRAWEVNEGVTNLLKPFAKELPNIAATGGLDAVGGDPAGNKIDEIKERLAAAQKNQEDLDANVVSTKRSETVPTELKTAAAAAGGAALVAGGLALANWVTNALDRRAWQKRGCEKIQDKFKRGECVQFIKNKTIIDLKHALAQCKTTQCKQMIQSKLQKIL